MIRFIAQVCHHGQLLGLHLLGNLLQHPVSGDLVGQISDHHFAILAHPACAHPQRTSPGLVHLAQVFAGSDDFSPGREVRSFDVFAQLIHGRIGLIQQTNTGGCDFPNIMGRNIRRHTNGNTRGTVEQHVRKPGRKHRGFFHGAIKVWHPIHGSLPELTEQYFREGSQPRFGISHGGKGFGIIRRPPVTLPVYQRVAVGKRLGHEHHGLVTGTVAVRVELTKHITHGTSRFLVLGGGLQPQLRHGVYNPPLYGLEPVPYVGQSPVQNDIHGIVQVRLLGVVPE